MRRGKERGVIQITLSALFIPSFLGSFFVLSRNDNKERGANPFNAPPAHTHVLKPKEGEEKKGGKTTSFSVVPLLSVVVPFVIHY
jgi:hypothetical protein